MHSDSFDKERVTIFNPQVLRAIDINSNLLTRVALVCEHNGTTLIAQHHLVIDFTCQFFDFSTACLLDYLGI